MKKILKSFFIIILSLAIFSCNKKVSEHEARSVLAKHLESRYGEPFEIGPMGIMMGRNRYYQADIIPKRYVSTPKERDKYYHAVGTVRIYEDMWGEKLGTGGDIYMTVRLNEDANAYFLPKLQELFGNQVLPVLQIDAKTIKGNGDYLKSLENSKIENKYFYIEGGIYVFTRIDDLETKDKYREKVYNFIQHMKSNNMFGQVNLGIYFLDERCLTDRFEKEIGNRLLKARYELTTSDEFIAYRRKQMKELDKDFEKMSKEDISKKINGFNREYLLNIDKHNDNKYSVIYHNGFMSRQFLEGTPRLEHYKKLDFDNIEDVKLLNTIKVIDKEYDKEKLYKNLWDGE